MFRKIGVVVATTVGAGMFALPYVFKEVGWQVGALSLLLTGCLITCAHHLYWRTLGEVGERKRLLGLAKLHFGKAGFYPAFFVLGGGLLFALVVYLILGGEFLAIIFPSLSRPAGVLVFWIAASLPLLFGLRRLTALELVGALAMAGIIVWVFVQGWPPHFWGNNGGGPSSFLFAFGPILFALAGWTAVEPVYDAGKDGGGRASPLLIFAGGTLVSAALYLLFVSGVFGLTSNVTTDGLSGLSGRGAGFLAALGTLGLFAIWTSYVPISLEIKNALEKDLKWRPGPVLAAIFLIPPLLIVAGVRSFFDAVSVAGGVFLGLQYVLIVLVGIRVLRARGWSALLYALLGGAFLLGAVYELYYFVIR